jgi:hypothetical protein
MNDTNGVAGFTDNPGGRSVQSQKDIIEREKLMKTEAESIVAEGRKRDLHLRLLGAMAFQVRCPRYNFLTVKLNRALSDIDLAAYASEKNQIDKMMRELGYADQAMVSALFGSKRMIWDNKSNGMHVDVFFDKLEMNHTISFLNRLELEDLTIPLSDMLLEKMQIVHINEKDIVDSIMLLLEHDVTNSGPETIDAHYLAKLLSNEWGFYYTVTTNLRKVQDRLAMLAELSEEDRARVSSRIETLLKIIEDQPKTLAWKIRARVGARSKWYDDVDSVGGG